MKRYEIREIDPKEMKRIAIYFTDEIEIKADDYSCVVDDAHIGEKVGFKKEGKNRKTWIHPVRTMVQILDKETGETIVLKSDAQILSEMGRNDLVEKWF